MPMYKKILAILDSADLYGKERANIEVYHILKESEYDVHVGFSKYAVKAMEKELSDFAHKSFPYPRDIMGKKRILKYIINYFRINLLLSWHIHVLNPDFILIPTEWALFYLYPTLSLTKAKIVFRCGDDPITYRKKSNLFIAIYAFLWKHFVLKRVDVLVCNARYIQNRMRASGRIDKGMDKIIYNYPPIRLNYMHENISLPTGKGLKVGFIGRLVPEKGVKELIEAMAIVKMQHKEMTLYIAGDEAVNSIYTLLLKKIINNQKLSDSVVFLGKINRVDVFYRHCDVICIPSIYEEPMANVVAESKTYRRPCIIFNQGGMPEIVEHKQTGYICNEVSIESLAKGLLFYIDNPMEIRKEGEAAFESINRLKLGKSTFCKKWVEVFQSIT